MFARLALALSCCALLALAGPARAQEDIVIVLDNSGSMRRNDPNDLAPVAVERFVARRGDDARVALLVFDETARLVTPLGHPDEARFAEALDAHVSYRGRLTNLPAAIERAVYHLRTGGREGARPAIVFLTDGRVDSGDPDRDEELEDWLAEGLAESAADAGIRLYGIAFTEDADFRIIESVTRRTSGSYERVLRAEDLEAAFERLDAARQDVAAAPEADVAAPQVPASQVPASQEAASRVAAPEVEAPAASTPTDEGEETGEAPVWALAAALGLLAFAVVVFVVVRLRRRSASADPAGPTRPKAPAPVMPKAYLMDTTGASGAVRHDLGELTVIGRKPSERDVVSVVIDHDTVSRRHASVRFRGGTFWLIDHQTRNGTFVNGERVRDERPLVPGDVIAIDKHQLVFDVEDWTSDEDATRYGEDDERTRLSFDSPSFTPSGVR
ncbi:MAG: FHA domain-containing protein [Myxococcota bacterium]|nr:FHA domain-containing protein [Myxococcota bacterium]